MDNTIMRKKRKVRRKKHFRLNRRRKLKCKFMSRIIADTNVWYLLGADEKLFESVRQSIVPVYNNLWEMSTTGLLHKDVKIIKVRDAIRRIMLCQERMILIEPLRYLVVIGNKKYKYHIRTYTIEMLKVTQMIARGFHIDDSMKERTRIAINEAKVGLSKLQQNINAMAAQCKSNIKNFKKHRECNGNMRIMVILDFMARQAIHGNFSLHKIPFRDYELLVRAMDCFFKKLETGELKWQRNDLFDLFNLAYVRRGDKYWTNEKRWIKIIKDAGCEEYLYKAVLPSI